MVRVYNEWSALMEVILGDPTNIYPPRPGSVVPSCFLPLWACALERLLYALRRRKPVPQFVQRHYHRELAVLERVLCDHGIAVSRPTPIEPMQDDPPGLSQVFPRDPAMVVGEKLVLGRQRVESLRKEIRGFAYLLTRFTEPSEIFGPFDIRRLREGDLVTNTEGMLPEAQFIFLDELLHANSAILNSLLTVLNE